MLFDKEVCVCVSLHELVSTFCGRMEPVSLPHFLCQAQVDWCLCNHGHPVEVSWGILPASQLLTIESFTVLKSPCARGVMLPWRIPALVLFLSLHRAQSQGATILWVCLEAQIPTKSPIKANYLLNKIVVLFGAVEFPLFVYGVFHLSILSKKEES